MTYSSWLPNLPSYFALNHHAFVMEPSKARPPLLELFEGSVPAIVEIKQCLVWWHCHILSASFRIENGLSSGIGHLYWQGTSFALQLEPLVPYRLSLDWIDLLQAQSCSRLWGLVRTHCLYIRCWCLKRFAFEEHLNHVLNRDAKFALLFERLKDAWCCVSFE